METKRKVSCFLSLIHEQHWPWGRQRGCIGHFTGAARIEKQNNCRSGIHCFDYFNIITLVGNAILCFIPYGNPKLRSSTTMLIVALACTDLLTTATVMPLKVEAVINSRRRFSDGVCRFYAFAMAVFAQISIYLVALTAFNRYLCIKKRNLFDKIFTKKRILLLIAAIWIVVLIINGLPNLLSLDDFFFCPGYLLCWRRMMSPAAIYLFNAWLYGLWSHMSLYWCVTGKCFEPSKSTTWP